MHRNTNNLQYKQQNKSHGKTKNLVNQQPLDAIRQQQASQEKFRLNQERKKTHASIYVRIPRKPRSKRKVAAIPPAAKKTAKRKPRNRGLHLTSSQWLQIQTIMIICIIGGAHGLDVAKKINTNSPNKPQNKKTLSIAEQQAQKEKSYREICGNKSFKTLNKANVTLITKNGDIMPVDCPRGDTNCEKETKDYNNGIVDSVLATKLLNARDNVKREVYKWDQSIAQTLLPISNTLSQQQQNYLQSILDTLYQFKRAHLMSVQFAHLKGGYCGEFTDYNIKQLLKHKLKYGLELKIAEVVLGGHPTDTRFGNHAFLLIDSNINNNIEIEDKTATMEFLNSVTGIICDTWNQGLLIDYATNINDLYKSDGGWQSVRVFIHSLNFEGFHDLPIQAQNIICGELTKIGLTVEPNDACGLFKKAKKEDAQSTPITQTHCDGKSIKSTH